jgi:lysozyme family protein
MTAFDQCFASVIASEGGYVNNAHDPGGMTNLGCTKRAWESWVGHSVDEAAIRALTPAIVAPFYRANYWNPIHGDALPPALALCVFHVSVNAGPGRAARMLQSVVGASPDGAIGPATLSAVTKAVQARVAGLASLVAAFQDALRDYYRSLPTFGTFGHGWLNRSDDVERQALAMIP